jgi:hypothetical protein
MRGEGCDGGKDALKHHATGEIQHRAEPGGGKRHGAEPPDHDCVGETHRHLREIGRSERCREGEGRTKLRAYAGARDPAARLIGSIDRFHLALSQLRPGAPADLRERP